MRANSIIYHISNKYILFVIFQRDLEINGEFIALIRCVFIKVITIYLGTYLPKCYYY